MSNVLHAKKNGIIEEIQLYDSLSDVNNKGIQIKYNGVNKYIAYGDINDGIISNLNCKINGKIYKILKEAEEEGNTLLLPEDCFEYMLKRYPDPNYHLNVALEVFPDNVTKLDARNTTRIINFFKNCVNLIKAPKIINISNKITDMSYMFFDCEKIKKIPLFDTSNLVNGFCMFSRCSEIVTLPVFNTSKLADGFQMFEACHKLTNFPVSDTKSLKNCASMFRLCKSMQFPDKIDLRSARTISSMFESCNFETIDLINTSNIEIFGETFMNCTNLKNIYLDCSSSKSLGSIFKNCINLTTVHLKITSTIISQFYRAFYDCKSLIDLTIEVTNNGESIRGVDIDELFYNCESIITIPMINLKFTNATSTFENCINLKNLPQLNFSGVENLECTFYNCQSLTKIPLINTTNVKKMQYTFKDCINLTDIASINVESVWHTDHMFENCKSLKSLPVLNFGISSTRVNASYMFKDCISLENIDLLTFGRTVGEAQSMFENCKSLKSLPANFKFDDFNADLTNMFKGCISLKSLPSEIDLGYCEKTMSMFEDCTSLESFIPKRDFSFNTSSNTTAYRMFKNCTNLKIVEKLDTSKLRDMTEMFMNCTNLTTEIRIDMTNIISSYRYSNAFTNCPAHVKIINAPKNFDGNIMGTSNFTILY